MAKGGLAGSAMRGFGTILLVAALFITFLQFDDDEPDAVGVIIAALCWILGIACYVINWRD